MCWLGDFGDFIINNYIIWIDFVFYGADWSL